MSFYQNLKSKHELASQRRVANIANIFLVNSELNASPTSVSTNIWLHLKMNPNLSLGVQNCSTAPGFSTRFALPRHRMVVPQSVWAPKDRVKSSFVSHHVEMGCFHNFAVHKTMIEIGLNTWDASIVKACSWAPIRWNIRNMFLVHFFSDRKGVQFVVDLAMALILCRGFPAQKPKHKLFLNMLVHLVIGTCWSCQTFSPSLISMSIKDID